MSGTSMHTSLTTPEEISKWCKSYNVPCIVTESIKLIPGKGVIFDRLNKLQTSNGHWNFVYMSPDSKEVMVYDPFGIPFYVPEFNGKKVVFSLEQDQRLNEKSCGLYCFLFAFKLFNNILKLSDYLVVDLNNKTYEIKKDNIDDKKLKQYENIYKTLHNEK